ncbi:molybdenum ABC transporter ATP-binding protein [Thiohalorhabdus sp.]|uniref:molybdenum ABC transporter ATP-binding protein n=1 Tax=Thiohalorhabdus sp. TaxID=3094134 RepID=UPI002FC371AB
MDDPFLDARFRITRPGFTLDAAFDAPGAGITALFGPSGSGKTTLLRCIAGLEREAEGTLEVAGELWQDSRTSRFLASHRRPIGYVFQEANLFPHRSVAGNLRYGAQRVQASGAGPGRDEVVALLGLGPFMDRRPHQLSGGQRQRVALGRALLTAPRLLLLDEPLAALDRASRAGILPYLERLRDELAIPALYVSHNMAEVTRLADRLVLLEEGAVVGSGPLAEMATRLDLPLARDAEAEAVVEAVVVDHDPAYGLTYLAFPGGRLAVADRDLAACSRIRVGVHARDVSLALDPPGRTSILNVIPATVTGLEPGDAGGVVVRLDASGTPLLARITAKSRDLLGLEPGTAVYAQIKSVALAEG